MQFRFGVWILYFVQFSPAPNSLLLKGTQLLTYCCVTPACNARMVTYMEIIGDKKQRQRSATIFTVGALDTAVRNEY